MADHVQIARLLQNLVGNALKFRGAGPTRIHLGAVRRISKWEFSVSDNGIGMTRNTSSAFSEFSSAFTRMLNFSAPASASRFVGKSSRATGEDLGRVHAGPLLRVLFYDSEQEADRSRSWAMMTMAAT